jgi:hypothetical protein
MIEGFLARVEKGSQFKLEESPVGQQIWLASHFSMQFRMMIALFFTKSSRTDETYFQYRPIGSLSPEHCQQP